MPDFETHPVGTARRLNELETRNARLRDSINQLVPVVRQQLKIGGEMLDAIEKAMKA